MFVVDGNALTSARIEAGLSQLEVASKVGANKGNVSRWERGVVVPTYVFIIKLAMLYNRCDFVKMAPKKGR